MVPSLTTFTSSLSPYPDFQDLDAHRPGRTSQFYICFYLDAHFSLYDNLEHLNDFDPLNRQPAAIPKQSVMSCYTGPHEV